MKTFSPWKEKQKGLHKVDEGLSPWKEKQKGHLKVYEDNSPETGGF